MREDPRGAERVEAGWKDELVQLDPDHPGFRDPLYRSRRNGIARLALEYRDGEPPPLVDYSNEEQAVWRTVWQRLEPLHERVGAREWRQGAEGIRLHRRWIPQLVEVNERLRPRAGIALLPVAGLISARGFLSALGRDVFLSTQYMRHHSMPLYTPEPDVVHELVGHATSFYHPDFAELSRLFGQAARVADPATLEKLERVYWYTLEFGVTLEKGELKAYGAGLLSSFGELGEFASRASLRPFDIERIAGTPYDPTTYQKILFVAPGFPEMVLRLRAWLEAIARTGS